MLKDNAAIPSRAVAAAVLTLVLIIITPRSDFLYSRIPGDGKAVGAGLLGFGARRVWTASMVASVVSILPL